MILRNLMIIKGHCSKLKTPQICQKTKIWGGGGGVEGDKEM